jgi:hypothetical protein
MKEYLAWFEQFVNLPPKLRKEKLSFIMRDLKNSPHKGHRKLAEMLKSNRYILVGVMPNIQYAIFDGAKDYLDAKWIHPMGFPNILVYDKELMCFMIVGTKIRFNDSVVNEMLRQSGKADLHEDLVLNKRNMIDTEGATG